MALTIQLDNPHSPDVETLIDTHLEFARSQTLLWHVFAMPTEKLVAYDVELYSCRDGDLYLALAHCEEFVTTTSKTNRCTPRNTHGVVTSSE
jgi:hypothetical protein